MSKEFLRLFDQLVPASGQADTVQGEVVRAIGRLSDEYFRNGCANWDDGYEILSAFALHHLTDSTFGPQTNQGIRSDLEHVQAYGRGQDIGAYDLDAAFDRLAQAAVGWCQRHTAPIPHSRNPALQR